MTSPRFGRGKSAQQSSCPIPDPTQGFATDPAAGPGWAKAGTQNFERGYTMDEFETDQRAEPLTWQSLTAVALSGLGSMVSEAGDTMEAIARLLLNAHHHELQRREFHEQAALEIETLIRGRE